ncbi:MAG: homoserine kinase [Polyangiaceae bacterium]|nr:homoserine kinase [Polyangiaceae bacterium]
MARLTPVSAREAARIAADFGLTFVGLTEVDGGSVNSNFRLETAEGAWFLRVFEEQDADGAARELALLRELAERGVPTTLPPRRLDGLEVSSIGGKPAAIYPWFRGEMVCTQAATPARCEQVAAALAQVHLVSAELPHAPLGRFEPEHLWERLARVRRSKRADLLSAVERAEAALERVEAMRSAELPSGLIHGDLFRDNVLWQGQRLAALLDFESACHGRFVFDLMVLIHAWCFTHQFELDRVAAVLRGYQWVRPLSDAERAALTTEGELAALRFVCTRLTDYSLRQSALPSGELQPPLRDFRRFFARLEALQGAAMQRALSSESSHA